MNVSQLNPSNFDYNIQTINDNKPFLPKEQGGTTEFVSEVYGVFGKF